MEGEEVADRIFTALRPYHTSLSERLKVLEIAKKEGVAHTRDHAHLISESVVFEDKSTKLLDIYDNGMEPVDVIYNFAKQHGIEKTTKLQQLFDSILPKVCQQNAFVCSRLQPIIYTHLIMNGKGETVGKIDIILDEEPVDSVHRFAIQNSLDYAFRDSLINEVCKKVHCTRRRPIVFQKSFTNEDGKVILAVDILEDEEVIDAAVKFLRKADIRGDLELTIKKYLLQNACTYKVKCTRNIAHVYDGPVRNETGDVLGHLVVREGEEPSDIVFKFCAAIGCNDALLRSVINDLCRSELVICNRYNPLALSLPLHDPDGNFIGNLEIELNEEPADAVYRFFSFHSLFQKGLDLRNVISQVCDISGVECSRKRAIKFKKDQFVMGKVNVGSITIWDDVEVVDALYQKRLEYNLTIDEQLDAYAHICSRRDIYCQRNRAVVYELKQITKRDFEKFGNETCSRKYNGWQYLSVYADSWIGAKLCNTVTNKIVGTVSGKKSRLLV